MAAEMEDCLSLQADSLPTGSVSFGRFEVESLSWERRSSFSHNRYLEEVEKYSTPGSVTQKKAYFEAHFKQKALLRQALSLSPNGVDSQTSENGIEDHVYMEEYVDCGNRGQHQFAWNDETLASSNDGKHDVMESNGGRIQFSWYDETPPAASDDDEYDIIESNEGQLQFQYDDAQPLSDVQHDVIDCKQELNRPACEIPIENMRFNNTKELGFIELVGIDGDLQSQSIFDKIQSDKDNSPKVVEVKNEKGSMDVDELPEKCDISSKNSATENDSVPSLKKIQESSHNVPTAVEQKPLKEKVRTTLTTKKTLTEKNSLSSSKAYNRTSREMEKVNTLSVKTEKQSFLKARPSSVSDFKIQLKDSENLKAPAKQGTRRMTSGKGVGPKKDNINPQSTGNDESFLRQPVDRPKTIVYPTKTNLKQSNPAFKFRSDERAEKRKEFVIRLGQKYHAKELQMNEIQTRTQVQTEAEIKQLRRSLNFKATPMPSFYNGAVPRDSNGKKKTAAQAKSTVKTSEPNRTDDGPNLQRGGKERGKPVVQQQERGERKTSNEPLLTITS